MNRSVYSLVGATFVASITSGAAEAAEGGMPQLNFHDFAPQLVWLLIAFVVLYLIMSRLAVPAIADTLEKRQARIQGDLDAAERASEDTRTAVTAYQKRLADAREDARRLTRERGEADASAASAELAKLGEKLGAQTGAAEKRIADQRAKVMEGLEDMAHDVAADVYARIAGQPADKGALGAKVAAVAVGAKNRGAA